MDNFNKPSTTLPTPTPSIFVTKPRIPSLMDLEITIPSQAVVAKKKGKPRLPTIADALKHSVLQPARCSFSEIKSSKPHKSHKQAQTMPIDEQATYSSKFLTEISETTPTNSMQEYKEKNFPHPCNETHPSFTPPLQLPLDHTPSNSFSSESSNYLRTPKILKISDRNESSRKPCHKKKKLILRSILDSQPKLQITEVCQRVDFNNFAEDWKTTRGSMVCFDAKGKVARFLPPLPPPPSVAI
ncbi:uncharacterized protein LOC118433878 isoform X1 [Folsomia candida]|nr:uncharacterized protein LOC118433878 isoform X1 [Folsomia candida]